PMFLIIAGVIVFGTVAIVQFGGTIFQVVPLTVKQWVAVFGLSALIIPMDLIRKIIRK
ncbi:MAG: cation transporting ATPase C-terminal domain-containing protein, partial [Alphaproteobacteria bacterium]|nr:cation transporting ATPase C-terminal domain-containing protein [Alphaproteobacteria bacterium]